MRILKRGPPDGKKQQSNDLKIISRKEIKIMKNKGKLLKKTILSFLLAAAMLCGIIPENATVANAASTSVSLSSLGRRGNVSIGSKSKSGTWWKMNLGGREAFCIDLGYTCHSGNSYAAVEKHQWNQDTGGAKNGNYAKVIRWYVIEKNRSKKGFVMSQALIWSIAEGRTSEAQLKDVIMIFSSRQETGQQKSRSGRKLATARDTRGC